VRSWPSIYLPPSPEGVIHPTLKLVDSYKNALVNIEDSHVSMYVCGITPYDATHLGHAATYLTFDLITRYLIASGRETCFIENITDIDDPLLERAERDQQNWKELAHSQIDLFTEDMSALRVVPPNAYQGVVESMRAIIDLISEHIASGLTYYLDGDIYLDLTQVPRAISDLPLPLEETIKVFSERGGDPDRQGKKHPLDPLLWRAAKPGEPFWNAPFGDGRPGWHVECVAIALKNLGSSFEGGATSITIQGGGSDLIFPHHFMTAIQAESLTKKPFAKAYVHAGMIGLDGEKMSKSRGNLVFVSQLLRQGVDPMVIRAALIFDHYQSDRMWSQHTLEEAQSFMDLLGECLSRSEVAPTSTVVQEIVNALANNVDTPRVLTLLRSWCEETARGEVGGSAGEMSRALDTYLGLAL
jgi:L-cysteine:1D-myo-inositol 2-amino-2-deoxy-alpha-D-glucopyranoside ligase